MGGIEEGSEAVEIGVPLPEHLVDEAAVPRLILDLPVLVAPVEIEDVRPHDAAGHRRLGVGLQLLPVVERDLLDV